MIKIGNKIRLEPDYFFPPGFDFDLILDKSGELVNCPQCMLSDGIITVLEADKYCRVDDKRYVLHKDGITAHSVPLKLKCPTSR